MNQSANRRFLFLFAAFLALGVAARLRGATPAPAWDQRLQTQGATTGQLSVSAFRVLADSSTVGVWQDGLALTIQRHDEAGTRLSTSTVYPPHTVSKVAIDFFGSVFVIAPGPGFWTMKYDGFTGKAMWPAAARLNAPKYGSPTAVAIDRTGDIFVAGISNSEPDQPGAIVKYDGRTGALRWGPVSLGTTSEYVVPAEMIVDPFGDPVVTSEQGNVWATSKFSGASGERIWGPLILGIVQVPMVCPGPCQTPISARLALDSLANVFLTVSSFRTPQGGGQGWLTVKYQRSTGKTLWGPMERRDESFGSAAPEAVAVDGNGDLFVSGLTLAGGRYGAAVLKYNGRTGTLLWGPVFLGSGFGSARHGLVVDGSGNVFLSSTVLREVSNSQFDWATFKCAGATGAILWGPVLFREGYSDTFYGLVLNHRGDAVVTGLGPGGVILSYSGASGALLSGPTPVVTNGGSGIPVALLNDANGGTLVVATSSGGPGTIIKYGKDGALQWGPVAFPVSPQSGGPVAAAIDSSGDLYVTGSAIDGQTTYGETVKYSGLTGKTAWVRSESTFRPVSKSLAIDPSGDVVLTGYALGNYLTWETVKYRGSSGATLWGPVLYQPLPPNYSQPVGLAVDGSGSIFVTGTGTRGDGWVWVTLKYDGTNGTLLWGPVLYEGDSSGSDYPSNLAVDKNGDLIVSGSTSRFSQPVWGTVKYSGRTGALIWGPAVFETKYGFPEALALDDSGDVFLAGVMRPSTEYAFATVKLSGQTGGLLWGPQNLAPSGNSTFSLSMTLDRRGNAIVAAPSSNGQDDDWTTVKYDGASGQPLFGPENEDTGDSERPIAVMAVGDDYVVAGTVGGMIRTVRYTETLSIRTLQEAVAPAYCGNTYAAKLSAANGTEPYRWSLASGDLPPGLQLDSSTGQISGSPASEGSYTFGVLVMDAAGRTARRDLTLDVFEGEAYLPILAIPSNAACATGGFTLSVPGSFSTYLWSPEAQTTSTITACPAQPSVYSVVVTGPDGCPRRGGIELAPYAVVAPTRMPLLLPDDRRRLPIRKN